MAIRVLAGRYEIEEKIGDGGMAVVFSARDKLLSRKVAIKILRPEYVKDESFVDNFRRESRAAAALSHPNIVSIYDVGREDNVYYIVMELIQGRPLSEIIEERAPMSADDVISVGSQIASALAFAHKNGIIHRDVKPHNILISESGGSLHAKITDFGIARAVSDKTQVSVSSTIMGSVHYFSPEQARGKYMDEKSDIYSLGIVLYEMLTGRVPFDADEPIAIALAHMNEAIIPPSRLVPGVPPGLEQVILTATEKMQVNRYRSAEDMRCALDDVAHLMSAFPGTYTSGQGMSDGRVEPRTPVSGSDDGAKPYVRKRTPKDGAVPKDKTVSKTPAEKQKRKRMIAIISVTVVLLLIIGGIAIYFLSCSGPGRGEELPNLIGMSLEEAQKAVDDLGLDLEFKVSDEEVYSDDIELGKVAGQDPKEKATVRKGDKVTVTLSKGIDPATVEPEPVVDEDKEVPDLVGMSQEAAERAIAEHGFTKGQMKSIESDKSVGTVLSQNPIAGDKAKEGSSIDITVSKGSELPVMPSILGLTEDEAKKRISEANLIPGKSDNANSDEYPKGTVMWQQYKKGEELEPGTKVDYKISSGSAEKEGEVTITLDLSEAYSQQPVIKVVTLNGDGSVASNDTKTGQKDAGSIDITCTGKGIGTVYIYMSVMPDGEEQKITYEADFGAGKATLIPD